MIYVYIYGVYFAQDIIKWQLCTYIQVYVFEKAVIPTEDTVNFASKLEKYDVSLLNYKESLEMENLQRYDYTLYIIFD